MALSPELIEAEALQLDEKHRARLARRLLLSLEFLSEDPAEVEKAWIEEALRRHAEMESGEVEGIPGEEVFRSIRASRRLR
ncbi:MAG TPA: addiction module protein [Thermoanaerobaculia bacterium]|nr:addiction module protein [Thermoanaerobaculia bacterium]